MGGSFGDFEDGGGPVAAINATPSLARISSAICLVTVVSLTEGLRAASDPERPYTIVRI